MQKSISILTFIIFILVSCSHDTADNEPKQDQSSDFKPNAEMIALNNQGVGEMGYFDYDKATSSFNQLVEMAPNWELALQNQAIALLNRQKPGDEELALSIADAILLKNSDNAVAHYIIAILNFNLGLCENAMPHFNKVLQLDPTDAYAYYFTGQCHLQNGDVSSAMVQYKNALNQDSYLRSVYYGSFMAAQRLGETELAMEMLDYYQRLEANPQAKLAEIKYTRMGPKAITEAFTNNPITTAKNISFDPPFFNSAIKLDIPLNATKNFGLVDLDQSGTALLYLQRNESILFYKKVNNRYEKVNSLNLTLNSSDSNLAWGDIDNDNDIDVYISGSPDQLYLNSEQGFEKADMNSSGFNTLQSKAVRLADTDHDGDLDILILNQTGEFEIWNNNLDGTFRPLSNETEWLTESEFNGIYLSDIDKDRDVDIILSKQSELTLMLNDRMWKYQMQKLPLEWSIQSLSVNDNNGNGLDEFSLLSSSGIKVLEYDIQSSSLTKINEFALKDFDSMLQQDVNGNGLKEYILSNSQGLSIVSSTGQKIQNIDVGSTQKVKALNTLQGPELLIQASNAMYYLPASVNRGKYLQFHFSGKEDDANSVRSNYSGIGTYYTVHTGGFYSSGNSFHNENSHGMQQDYQSQTIASGSKGPVNYIEMQWSDGVYQTELGLQPEVFHLIPETQRQLSSCPVIFAWNEGKYEFVSDVLGVGGIGFAIGRNTYGVPRPWENYLMKDTELSSDGQHFRFQFTEPMEESAYLDQFSVEVIDVPSEFQVVLDERMVINPPNATGEPLFYRQEILPISVFNNLDKDVTEALIKRDKIAADLINDDHRFLGIIDEQFLTLEFAEELNGSYQMLISGWVEYGYSQTMFAAWQAGLSAQAPTVEAFINGKWQPLLKEFGYPAGMPRESSVAIEIPAPTNLLRLRTNMEIYFDHISLVQPLADVAVQSYELELDFAQLHQLGFPKRTDNQQRLPDYDFDHIEPFWDARYMEGAYTRLGEITELVNQSDNALAIIGSGEAIEFYFLDNLPDVSENHSRYFILKFKGWAKDMDLMTKDGDTLEPLPFDGIVSDTAAELNYRYNTRFQSGK